MSTSRALRAWLDRLRERATRQHEVRWTYLVITPLGMDARGWLEAQLGARGVQIALRRPIAGWPRVATAIRVRRFDPESLRRAVLYEAAWEKLFPGGAGEAWGIAPQDLEILARDKQAIRAPLRHRRISLGVLHPFHLPDAADAETEARALECALELSRA